MWSRDDLDQSATEDADLVSAMCILSYRNVVDSKLFGCKDGGDAADPRDKTSRKND